MKINYLDLFSGVGGFAYACQLAEVPINPNAHFYSDIEESSNRVYQKHFPNAKPLGDITRIDGNALRKENPGPWFITGGFPCQSVSCAGKRKGLADATKSGLWFHYWRLVGELRPQAILIENVSALASNGLDRVAISLAKIGYDAEWETISACSVGAPHLRKRIWIVAYPNRKGATIANATLLRCDGTTEPHPAPRSGDLGEYGEPDRPSDWQGVWLDWQTTALEGKVSPATLFSRMDDGVSNKLDRVKMLGNAIVPQVAYGVMRRMQSAGLLPRISLGAGTK